MVKELSDDLAGVRNKAILLIGFAGALRRSEIANLGVEAITFDVRGMILALGKTKTDQSGEHDEIAIPLAKGSTCPVKALKDWLKQSHIQSGPVFRAISKGGKVSDRALNPHSIAQLIKTERSPIFRTGKLMILYQLASCTVLFISRWPHIRLCAARA